MAKIKIALVAGASGSGKTLIAKMFRSAYVHTMDNYFRGPFAINKQGVPEWDKKEAVDLSQWALDLHRILEAVSLKKRISLPVYEFKTHEVSTCEFNGAEWAHIEWIVLEGIFALEPRFHHLADLKIFVDAPFEKRVARRLKRDLGSRSDDLLFILTHSYFTEVSYQKDIEPMKQYADLIIPNYET